MRRECTVVIPTYNAATTLGEQLAALAAQQGAPAFEVVVADNGSTDDSAAVALAWVDRLPHLRVVDASRARGVAAARNDGIRAARTDVILLCDADDVVDAGWVAAMLEALQGADFVGGALDIRTVSGRGRSWVPLPERTSELPTTWGDRPYAFGGNLGMRRRVFGAVGGFDESYGAGAEEIDFAWRALEAGYRATFAPDAVVHYRIRDDLRGVLRQQYHSGLGTAQLYATFRPAEARPRAWHRRVRHELALLRTFPWRADSDARKAWLTLVAFDAGKIRGAIRHRCAVP
jgi:GT2 family glycosyltransferase